MATRTEILLLDDIDGGPAEETVTFSLDGQGYVIDLSADHAAWLRGELVPYVSAGRRTGRPAKVTARPGQQTKIRAWAKAHGVPVKEHGRIPGAVVEAYRVRDQAPPPPPVEPPPAAQAATPPRKAAPAVTRRAGKVAAASAPRSGRRATATT
jgi:hypothetical protein